MRLSVAVVPARRLVHRAGVEVASRAGDAARLTAVGNFFHSAILA